jgi:hypothetical protein
MATFRPTDGADVATGDGIFEPSKNPSGVINIRDI